MSKENSNKKSSEKTEKDIVKAVTGGRRLDPVTTIAPLVVLIALCATFVILPDESTNVLSAIRNFLGTELGLYYLVVALGIFLVSLYIAFSDLGKVRLGGKDEKPKYGFFAWGAMVFCCGLAADILFYSFCEWIYYAEEPRVAEMGRIEDWANAIPLYHWGPIVWSFYAVLAACFGFMIHVRGSKKQKYSEACRPILGKHTDGVLGKIIDILAIVALIAGTATTFSVATPLLGSALTTLFGIPYTKWVTIAILLVTCATYTTSVMIGMKGVNNLSKICMVLFGLILIFVLVFSGKAVYILENGFSSLGLVVQNFPVLSTYTDALRENGFAQNWTMYYWAYWLVWCVAAPFFMGNISRGRTVKQVILGTYAFGLASTLISFIVLGNYGLGLQVSGQFDAIGMYEANGYDLYAVIIEIIKTLPCYQVVLVLLILSMIAFYATSFDSITLVASSYSYKNMRGDEMASKKMKLFWAMLLILLPIALIFSESSMNNIQSVSIIAAFPVGMVIILIIASFIKDARKYIDNQEEPADFFEETEINEDELDLSERKLQVKKEAKKIS
ncbi:MAG: BCCT family transporter [Eubacterium sp.]|nr:BCCT family transporter [Eubacterium sp.]